MAFSSYKTTGEVLKAFQVKYTESNFMSEREFHVSDYFREDLQTVMREGVVNNRTYALTNETINAVEKKIKE
ncbi:MAG: hypothetical protein PUP92_36020 [Rhizonema sp. PD38]|nr:hypothetical protein [Rhizonema sp. PD38]